jgi:hypothetical protein
MRVEFIWPNFKNMLLFSQIIIIAEFGDTLAIHAIHAIHAKHTLYSNKC